MILIEQGKRYQGKEVRKSPKCDANLTEVMKSKHFSKGEFEAALHNLTVKSDYKKVSAGTGISANMLSQYFNPAHIRESLLFRAAAILAEFIKVSPERGREMLRRFVEFVERAFPEVDRTVRGLLMAALAKTEVEIAEVKRLAKKMGPRQLSSGLVSDRSERRKSVGGSV